MKPLLMVVLILAVCFSRIAGPGTQDEAKAQLKKQGIEFTADEFAKQVQR